MSLRTILSGLVNLKEGESELYFKEKLDEWMCINGWTYKAADPINAPSEKFIQNDAVYFGSAVFHPEYQNELKIDVNRRYFLRRIWDPNLPVMTVFMMNPSSANELVGDATVDFVMNYAQKHKFGALYVVNTSPVIKGSKTIIDDYPNDPDNWFYIQYAINNARLVVLGWGEKGRDYGVPQLRSNYEFKKLLESNLKKLHVFDYGENTRRAYPKHPHPQVEGQRFNLDHPLIAVTPEMLEKFLIEKRGVKLYRSNY